MNYKKGMQLSIQFFVLLILALAIFGYSINFIYSLFSEASKLEDMAFNQLDERVESLTCGTQQVCVGTTFKTINRGSFKIFGLRVLNSRSITTNFNVKIDSGVKPDQAQELLFVPKTRDFSLNAGETQVIGVGIEVPNDALSGIYVFDIKVEVNDQPYGDQPTYKIKVKVP